MRIGLYRGSSITYNSPNDGMVIATLLNRMGIDVVHYNEGAVVGGLMGGDESSLDGLICYDIQRTNATDAAVCMTQHSFGGVDAPILTLAGFNTSDNGATLVSGMASRGSVSSTPLELSLLHGGVSVGKLYTTNYLPGVKSSDWTDNPGYYTTLIQDGANPDVLYAWRRTSPTADVIYSQFTLDISETPHVIFLLIGYYLRLLGKTASIKYTPLIDLDDPQLLANVASPGHCLSEYADWLRANNTICVVGVCQEENSNWPRFLANTNNNALTVLAANADVYKFTDHDHHTYIWYDDTDYPDVESKVAAWRAEIADLIADTGLPVSGHYNGYRYLPMNYPSQVGLSALAGIGVKRLRINRDATASIPGETFGYTPTAGSDMYIRNEDKSHMLTHKMSPTYGGSASYTWAAFHAGTAGSEPDGLRNMTKQLISGWRDRYAINVMMHGCNWSIDPAIDGEGIVMRFLRLSIDGWSAWTANSVIDLSANAAFRFMMDRW